MGMLNHLAICWALELGSEKRGPAGRAALKCLACWLPRELLVCRHQQRRASLVGSAVLARLVLV